MHNVILLLTFKLLTFFIQYDYRDLHYPLSLEHKEIYITNKRDCLIRYNKFTDESD